MCLGEDLNPEKNLTLTVCVCLPGFTYNLAWREVVSGRACGCHCAADQQREEQLEGGHGAAATQRESPDHTR